MFALSSSGEFTPRPWVSFYVGLQIARLISATTAGSDRKKSTNKATIETAAALARFEIKLEPARRPNRRRPAIIGARGGMLRRSEVFVFFGIQEPSERGRRRHHRSGRCSEP
jgi:hypothetical protein